MTGDLQFQHYRLGEGGVAGALGAGTRGSAGPGRWSAYGGMTPSGCVTAIRVIISAHLSHQRSRQEYIGQDAV
ncbi:hypothetical protein HPP92_028816 [Vanilla planifolia]|uniref:Uncharacterized protein n=1 Tax=Vanilla planifolia TaxID=51239 RepID=A0A835P5Z3_VANPL|nr:hypothetical protein HPP92_028816 [Vanilla planifolia]KAG0446488.1 hypothetical protein HPP92_028805 [Vanilla planifolia]